MSHYEISPEERYDEWERDNRESAEYLRNEDERFDFARTSQVPGRQEDERG